MWTDAADPSGYRMGKSKEHVHPNTNPQKSENHQSGRRHRHNFFGITSLFFFFFFLASSSSSAGYRITQSSTCAWISAHICVRVSYFLESPPDSFQIFLASFEFIWITTVRLIAGWIITQLDSLTVPPVDRSSCSGGSTGVSIPSLRNQWRFEFNWFNSPFFSRLGEKLPSRRHLRRPDGHVHSTANIR